MITFLQVSLYLFTFAAWLGLIPGAVIGASQHRPVIATAILIAAAFATFVFLTAAGRLH